MKKIFLLTITIFLLLFATQFAFANTPARPNISITYLIVNQTNNSLTTRATAQSSENFFNKNATYAIGIPTGGLNYKILSVSSTLNPFYNNVNIAKGHMLIIKTTNVVNSFQTYAGSSLNNQHAFNKPNIQINLLNTGKWIGLCLTAPYTYYTGGNYNGFNTFEFQGQNTQLYSIYQLSNISGNQYVAKTMFFGSIENPIVVIFIA